ncbi:MAG: sugar phosphate isomerase/epimerase [Clostridia bacterium]|nr:sugar phosphate isomerase/epimerase [Clostridia bacterium]
MRIGAQFYTIREFCKTPDDLAESLKRVADIGYEYVQISGTCEYEPLWMKEQLSKNGLTCVLTHTPAAKLLEDPKQIAENHTVFGCDKVGLGYFTFNTEKGETPNLLAEKYLEVAKVLKENGKYFMYHNHAQEFSKFEGKVALEHYAELFPADLMGFTLDTYWVQTAGGDPAQWIEKLSGRVPCIHLKDHTFDRKMAVVGEGNINFDAVFAAAEKAGTQYMLVEQDDCNGEDPFDCLKRSYNNLKAMGFK